MKGAEHRNPTTAFRFVCVAGAAGLAAALAPPVARADDAATTAAMQRALPRTAPPWMPFTYSHMMRSPLPVSTSPEARSPTIPKYTEFPNDLGRLGQYVPNGPVPIASNAFFQSLGTNGRSCATCHDPASAMSVSLPAIQSRFLTSLARDPLFAPVDGATCPKNVPVNMTSAAKLGGLRGQLQSVVASLVTTLLGVTQGVKSPYYAILSRGLIRIPLPVPANAEFTVTPVTDPFGCNTDPAYNKVVDVTTGATSQIVSVYRRPVMSSDLLFRQRSAADIGIFGLPPGVDPAEPPADPNDPTKPNMTPDPFNPGRFLSGNIMWDGREPTLQSQALDATLSHAQALTAPTAAQIDQIVAFETSVFSAQAQDKRAGSLSANANGGPIFVSSLPFGQLTLAPPVVDIYNTWANATQPGQASIVRGQALFNTKTFVASNVIGFNDAVGNNLTITCSTCHNQKNVGMDGFPQSQHGLGISGGSVADGGNAAAKDLPVFRVDCKAGFTMPFSGTSMLVNDPGKALITGKCKDVGRMTVSALRGLAGHAPYFHDGSAKTLADVVGFYDRRFSIGLTPTEKADLAAFLGAL